MATRCALRRVAGLLLIIIIVVGCDSEELGARRAAAVAAPDIPAGQRIYREGIRPSGEALTAIVSGDVPLLGTQFSCQSCHGRSGMGAAEGQVVVPAIAGPLLYAPSPQPERPGYDTASLARALRDGLDPTGRRLDELMPRFALSDAEIADLAAYLATLSAGESPGVDESVIRFATVVTDDGDPRVREAVLAVLTTYVDEKNRQTRLESQRRDRGMTPASRLPTVYREWVLDIWTLEGPSGGWREQLEQRYESAPVFAMLGGLSPSTWGPIGRFCEDHEVPCLFPSTDLPQAAEHDFYTQHYSRGLELEADLIASDLAAHAVSTVIQVYCGAAPTRAAEVLRAQLTARGVVLEDLAFECGDSPPIAELATLKVAMPAAAAVLWLTGDQLAGHVPTLPTGRTYFSSTLLDGKLDGALGGVTGSAFVAHPYRLPGQADPALLRFTVWARTRNIDIIHPRFQSEAFFACLAMKEAVVHLDRFRVRDYVLDMLDHAQDLVAYVPVHPRPTLGPEQRFLTKGGYVLPVVDGRLDATEAAWILP